jgi:prophage regulatory protein
MVFVGTDFKVTEEDIMNILPTDAPITKTKLQTRKFHLPETGFLRIKDIIAPCGPIPVSKSTWWAGVKSGRFPQPVRSLGDRITAWRVEDIRAWIDRQKTVNS